MKELQIVHQGQTVEVTVMSDGQFQSNVGNTFFRAETYAKLVEKVKRAIDRIRVRPCIAAFQYAEGRVWRVEIRGRHAATGNVLLRTYRESKEGETTQPRYGCYVVVGPPPSRERVEEYAKAYDALKIAELRVKDIEKAFGTAVNVETVLREFEDKALAGTPSA